jgi:hypothetical protein
MLVFKQFFAFFKAVPFAEANTNLAKKSIGQTSSDRNCNDVANALKNKSNFRLDLLEKEFDNSYMDLVSIFKKTFLSSSLTKRPNKLALCTWLSLIFAMKARG